MKRNLLSLTVAVVLAIIFVFLLFTFQVRTTQVAVVTTFGKPTREITSPGFKVKLPWPIQRVHKFDQRVHNFESKFEQVLTPDGYNLLIMVYVGWKISEPKAFFPRFGDSTARAEENLEGLVRNAYSGVVGKHPFSHFISTDQKELKFVEIENEMLQRIQADAAANRYGIEIRFLGIKKLGLPESVTQLVFDRMKSERAVLENEIKYEGERQARAIRDAADLEGAKLLAEAEAQATRIRGEGEKIAAESYNVFQQDVELASFLFKLNGLELFLKERTTLILDPRTPPLDLLNATPAMTPAPPNLTRPGDGLDLKPATPGATVPAASLGKTNEGTRRKSAE